ncbi:hypothetical protein GCM10018963_57170 [Saccharothrix longispora]
MTVGSRLTEASAMIETDLRPGRRTTACRGAHRRGRSTAKSATSGRRSGRGEPEPHVLVLARGPSRRLSTGSLPSSRGPRRVLIGGRDARFGPGERPSPARSAETRPSGGRPSTGFGK